MFENLEPLGTPMVYDILILICDNSEMNFRQPRIFNVPNSGLKSGHGTETDESRLQPGPSKDASCSGAFPKEEYLYFEV